MSDIEVILIGIAIIVGILVLVGVLIWGISAYARDQRRAHGVRTPIQPIQPLPSPTERQNIPELVEHPRIRWGDMAESDIAELEVERVRFGNIEQVEEHEYIEVAPYSDDPIVKCPVCHGRIDENEGTTIVCPECQESCHQHCWQHMNNECPICGYEER